MPAPRPARRLATVVAAVLGLAALGVATPASGQAEPGASSSTTSVDDPSTTTVESTSTVPESSTTTAVPGTDTAGSTDVAAEPPPPEGTPFPVGLVAPVPPVEGAPDTAITDVYVTDGATPDEPDVVVQFREPFTFAGTPYRVGVVIGDPDGVRLRTWLISNGPENLPYGRVERFEDGTWTELGATPVQFEDGLMIITVPIAEAPGGDAVWVEIVENDADEPSHTTPYFSRDALFGTADAGTVPSATYGRIHGLDGLLPGAVELGPGGTLVAIEDRITVTFPEPPPTEVDGKAVTSAVDVVRIAPDFDERGVVAHSMRLDRTTGETGLYDGFSPVPVDVSGDRSWLLQAPPPREAGSLILDRTEVVEALGLPDGGAGIAIGVNRELVLEDGSFVGAEGVLATDAWLDLAPISALPEVTTTTAAPEEATDPGVVEESRLPLLIGAAVGLVVVLGLLVLARRRAARRREATAYEAVEGPRERVPWGAADGDLIITTTHEFDALIPDDATPPPTPSPVAAPDPVPRAAAGTGVRILADPVAPPPAAVDPDPPATDAAPSPVAPAAASGPPVAAAPPSPAVSPAPTGAPPAGPATEAPVEPGPLDAEPRWGGAPVAATPGEPTVSPLGAEGSVAAPEPAPPAAVADPGDGPAPDDGDDDEAHTGEPALEPGRVDPLAALSALEDDLAELRKRVGGLGNP